MVLLRRSRLPAWAWVGTGLLAVGIALVLVVAILGSGSGWGSGSGANTIEPAAPPRPTGTPSDEPTPQATTTPTASPADTIAPPAHTALAVLDTLEVKGRAAKTGYSRDQFGQRWLDVDHNGCDTRNDILARDLTGIQRSGRCKVLSGTLLDPYTATDIHFVRGQDTSAEVQIDHVVSLSDAWQTGAQKLSPTDRTVFANDPLNLFAVSGAANEQKGDGDAATWLPKNKAFRCQYVARQVSVKAAYRLWVTTAEHDAIARILASCPNQPAIASALAPAPAADGR